MDECGWDYEFKDAKPQWNQYAHTTWLKKADQIIDHCNFEGIAPHRAIEIYELIKGDVT